MPIVDVHNHFYPPEYLDALDRLSSSVRVTYDDDGNPLVHYPGDYNIVVRDHRDIAHRQAVLDTLGVDRQILSLTTPGTHVETPSVALALAAIVNDAFARIVTDRSRHFLAFATLPLCDARASLTEFLRAIDQLKLAGAMLFSNVNGIGLDDTRFWPLYEAANDRDAVLMIHPTYPVGVEAMKDYWLMPLNGFLFDTTLTASKLVFSGVAKRYPRIRWVLGHLGGTIPYLAERLDRGYEAFAECRAHIDEPPTAYLKRHFFYDTVNFSVSALTCAIEFAGADRLLAGSDYPHQIGSLARMVQSIHDLRMPDAAKAGILGGNMLRLLAPTSDAAQ
jgi:aminocarboxymuconate-semialdehyde decarboxylase